MDAITLAAALASATKRFRPILTAKPKAADVQPVATPSGQLTWSATPQGAAGFPYSVGVDGALYGQIGGTGIFRSQDSLGAQAATTAWDFGAGNTVRYVTRTTEGFVAVTGDNVADTGTIWFSDALTVGWRAVQTTRCIQVQGIGRPVHNGPDGKTILLFGEYLAPGTGGVARNLWMSRDGGITWAAIRQSQVVNSTQNSHCHGSAYDPTRRRIWSSTGDLQNAWFGYSDDLGKSWVPVPIPSSSPLYDITNAFPQPVAVLSFPDRVLGAADRGSFAAGLWDLDPDTGVWNTSYDLPSGETAPYQYGFTNHAMRGKEAYVSFPDTGSGSAKTYFIGTGDFGRTWWPMGSLAWAGAGSVSGIVGPDGNGYLFHKAINSTAFGTSMIRAKVPTWTWSNR